MNLTDTKARCCKASIPKRPSTRGYRLRSIIAGDTEPRAIRSNRSWMRPSSRSRCMKRLRDLSQDFLFPGLEHVPPNTVTLLETNPKFVESFLVGLNAEMSRELLWRNYPTDQRGTYFRQFWDTSAGSEQPDIDTITKWGDRKLGENARAGEQAGAAPSRRAAAPVPELGDLRRGGGAKRRAARAVVRTG